MKVNDNSLRKKNFVLLAILLGIVALLFFVTMARIGGA